MPGCLLPLLITLNLFFGWLIFKPLYWLLIEIGLIMLFFLQALIFTKKIKVAFKKNKKIIDVEGEVVDEKQKGGNKKWLE